MQYTDPEQQREYDEAMAALDAAAQPATTARDDKGQFAKAEASAPEPVKAPEPEPAAVEPAAEPAPEPVTPEMVAELKAEVEKAKKVARDNQAAYTRAAQEAAALRRQQEQQQREATKPAILDANPELAEAIRYVASDPAPQQQAETQQKQFQSVIEAVHPDVFSNDLPEELQTAIATRWQSLGDEAKDPLAIVRVITEEKLAHNERQVGKRFAAEAAKLQQKSAMSVPGAGSSSVAIAPVDEQAEAVRRFQTMSDADFAKEVRRVKGYD